MFDDFGKMLKMAGEMKRRLGDVQAKLAAGEFAAQAGGGAVSATVNGKGQLIDIRIDKAVLADCDMEMLADLVKAAVGAAQEKAAAAAAEAVKEVTGGMSLPGLEYLLG
jgi:hypothetical protein